jgi:hypothetical protein
MIVIIITTLFTYQYTLFYDKLLFTYAPIRGIRLYIGFFKVHSTKNDLLYTFSGNMAIIGRFEG